MIVLYRLCPQGNPLKSRPNGMDKRKVVETAYKSFLDVFNCETKFIIDKPENWIVNMVKDRGEITKINTSDWESGNKTSFMLQLKMASELKEPVLLLEDDYLWLDKNAQEILDTAILELGIVSPYDHPNHYFEKGYDVARRVVVSGDRHWQSIISTTLTFGILPKLVNDYWDEFTGNGTVDDLMWKSIDHRLWSPMPALATHMETNYLSPTFKWSQVL